MQVCKCQLAQVRLRDSYVIVWISHPSLPPSTSLPSKLIPPSTFFLERFIFNIQPGLIAQNVNCVTDMLFLKGAPFGQLGVGRKGGGIHFSKHRLC